MRDFSYTDMYLNQVTARIAVYDKVRLATAAIVDVDLDYRGCERLAKWLMKAAEKLRARKAQPKRKHDAH